MNIFKHHRYLIFIVFLLFLGSYTTNIFFTSSQGWFENFQDDSASLPLYTQISHFDQHKHTNIQATGGLYIRNYYLKSRCRLNTNKKRFKTCYNRQIKNPKLYKSILYLHNSGLSTTITLRPIWYIVNFLKRHTQDKWKVYYIATQVSNFFMGVMTALVITLTILWIYLEFNFITSLIVFIYLFLFSPWLTVSSHNVYWVIYTMFIPFLLSAFTYYYKFTHKILILFILFLLFATWNFLAHFEYTTSFLIFSMLPVLYYEFKCHNTIKQKIFNLTILSVALILGFILSIGIFLLQMHIIGLNGIDSLIEVMSQRVLNPVPSGATALILASHKATYFSVIKTYITTRGRGNSFLIEYPILILFFIASVILIFTKTLYNKKILALLISTWSSLLVPLSWYILAKPHSFVHPHINFILWTFSNIFIFIFISYISRYINKSH